MGIGAMIVKGAAIVGTGALLYTAVLVPVLEGISGSNAVVEQSYVNPKALSIQGKKNAAGNIETYLNYKSGEEILSLPVQKGPKGPLVGNVDYWWESIGAGQREGLAVSEWPAISNDSKHRMMADELQKILDTVYGAQGSSQTQLNNVQKQIPAQQPQQQYRLPKK